MRSTTIDVEGGYQEWGERLVAEGWSQYLLTFMYRHMHGSDGSVFGRMERDVERVYKTHVSHVVHHPKRLASIGRHPVWFVSPDRPVFKHKKGYTQDVLVNEGRHMHASAFYPPRSRLREDVAIHFFRLRDLYVRSTFPLIRIDVEPVDHDPGYVVGYGRKHIGRGLVGEDATLILPRSLSEVRDRAAKYLLPREQACQLG